MSLAGRTLYQVSHYFRHGLAGSLRREFLLPKVIDLPPLEGMDDPGCEVHVLTSRGDWLMLVWALRTFYRASGLRCKLCIHEDGSLDTVAVATLRAQFPEARLIRRDEADRLMEAVLADAPRCKRERAANNLLLKTFDFHAYLEADRMLMLDSDVLFFRRPDALVDLIVRPGPQPASFNRDWRYGYSIPAEELAVAEAPWNATEPLFNSGLGVLPRGSVPPGVCEELFARFPSLTSHHHLVEQTLIALCAHRHGHVFLPAYYDVHDGSSDFRRSVRHYSGPFRARFYAEGLPHVWKRRDELL